MKIVVLHPPMYPVNHEFYNLLGENVELIVYQIGDTPAHHTTWTNSVIRQGIVNYKLKIFGKGSVSLMNQVNLSFVFEIIKEKPDIVLSIAFWVPSLYASILKFFLGFKFIILTNMIEATEMNVSLPKQAIRTFISKRTDVLISASTLTTDYLAKQFPHVKIKLSLQTINVTQWKKELSLLTNKQELLKKLNISSDKNIMLGIGNFTEKKNWKSVIKILPNIKKINFILVGNGEQENEYRIIIKRLGLEDKVSIVGRKDGDELLEYLKISDFFIFPSLYDQFGFVVPEALASGLPVLCTKYAGASSLIKDGVNGYLIDPKKDFTEKIKSTIDNIEVFKKNSFVSINNLTIENRVNEFLNIFNEVKLS